MAVQNKLSDAKVRGSKAGEKPVKLFDGGSLYLYIVPTGAKSWRMAYRLDGKPKTMTFGPYPDVSLARARLKRDEVKALLREGADPMAPRRKHGLTLNEASAQYWQGRKDLSPSYLTNATRAIEQHLSPTLGARMVGAITREELLAVLMVMDAAGLHEYVRKTRMWVGQVLDWAVEHGHAQTNVAALIKPEKAFGKRRVEHFAALNLTEVPAFMERLDAEGDLQSALALRLLALTWVRTNEMRFMRWDEVTGDTWVIPAGKMKRRLEHVVPLSVQALAVLEKLRSRSRGSVYVFPAEHRGDRPISENAVLALLARMGYKGKMTGHGFRTVASTWAHENGYLSDAVERQLAHTPGNAIKAAYNRAQHLPLRRQMMEDFAGWIGKA